jgi:two-component system, cell cycle response regulator DivK
VSEEVRLEPLPLNSSGRAYEDRPHVTREHCLALLVDRDPDSRQIYAECLRQAAYEVEQAEDGREALAKAISQQPHVIITETQIPGIDGYRLCELLKAEASTQATPIIIVTGDAHPPDLLRAERSGADAVLTKPCRPERLLEEIRQCLETAMALRQRAVALRSDVDEPPARTAQPSEKSQKTGARTPFSKTFNRHTTATPALPPPNLVCPSCDTPLVYQDSHIGGVSEHHREQWDYFECPAKCGRFQYRQRTRKLRKLV